MYFVYAGSEIYQNQKKRSSDNNNEHIVVAFTVLSTLLFIIFAYHPIFQSYICCCNGDNLIYLMYVKLYKGESNFDVGMGAFDGADSCDLIGLYLLHIITTQMKDL